MITDVTIVPCENSDFVKPKRIKYSQTGISKVWDMVDVHDSVAILLYHEEHEALVVVRQFRPPVYLKNNDGYTYELCAGIIDKDKSLVEIAHEEILEECGYHVPLEKIERITSFYTAVGFAGSVQTLYYASVNEMMRVNEGGGVGVESIEVIELPVCEAKAFSMDETKAKTPGLMFGFGWFLENKL
ncbi:MAG: NUDIX hydrolase [Sulfuricurvum sp.]|uniref:NUDIX domain-containing protein n=1 Tax=Sulfuricurvum sp. TaxID=2025608 RepID=UPI0027329FAC|nr:NUDIX hydrolase [Sulfuricurvum sp.]MDP2850961.1 NUDIX hydrolase [Sulfuricurvum sp.]MDP3291275.1 NUDIX hydrolase [Sulfuricurvum sp.]